MDRKDVELAELRTKLGVAAEATAEAKGRTAPLEAKIELLEEEVHQLQVCYQTILSTCWTQVGSTSTPMAPHRQCGIDVLSSIMNCFFCGDFRSALWTAIAFAYRSGSSSQNFWPCARSMCA